MTGFKSNKLQPRLWTAVCSRSSWRGAARDCRVEVVQPGDDVLGPAVRHAQCWVEAPTALLQFKSNVWRHPCRWAGKYYNLQRWNVAKYGGHLAPMNRPQFRPMTFARSSGS
jgi:hypothetical protein